MENRIGKRIEHYRLKTGMTQQEAADCLGISRSVYSEIENGTREPIAAEIGQLASLFQIRTDSLIYGEDASEPDLQHSLPFKLLTSLQGYFEVNLSENEIIGNVIEMTGRGNQKILRLETADGTRFSYDMFQQWFAENLLVSTPKQFLEKSSRDYLISCLQSGKGVADLLCTARSTEGEYRDLRLTYYLSEDFKGDIYAICLATSFTDSAYSRQFTEIATKLSESFEGIFYVNTDDDTYVALKMKGAFYNITQNISGHNFFQNTMNHSLGVVHDDDYSFVKDFLQKDHLLDKLDSGNITSTIFQLQVNGKAVFYRLRVSRSEYDDHHILLALENVSEFVINERIQNKQLMRDKRIIEVLSSEYSSVYYVDLSENSFEIYKQNNKYVSALIADDNSSLSYTDAFRKCVEEIVYEPDQSAMMKAGSIYNILAVLKEHPSFSTIYRAKKNNGASYCEMKIARVGNDPMPTHVVIGFADNSAEKAREIEKEKNISVILQLTNNFEAVFDVDIRSGRFTCYSESDIFAGKSFFKYIESDDLFQGIADAADRIAYVDDRPLLKTCLTREYLQNTLKTNAAFTMDVRLLIHGIPTWYQIKVVMDESSNGQKLIIGIFNIEEQRQKEYSQITKLEKLTREAQYDALTGIRNKNAYMLFETEMNRTMQKSAEGLAVALFDINDLKTVNDQLGHMEGDRLIRKVAGIICEVFQHSPVFRVGGDEFAVILSGRDFEQRNVLIDSIYRTSLDNIGTCEPVIACGISDRNENDRCLADVFARADEEMYRNKNYLKSIL